MTIDLVGIRHEIITLVGNTGDKSTQVFFSNTPLGMSEAKGDIFTIRDKLLNQNCFVLTDQYLKVSHQKIEDGYLVTA